MNSTPARLFLGVLAALPLLYCALFAWHISTSSTLPASQPEFDSFFRIHMIASFAIFAIIGVYIVYLFRTDRVPQPKKALWAVVLFMGNMVALPVFWFIYIRPETWPAFRPDL
jgi:hypothetical protein